MRRPYKGGAAPRIERAPQRQSFAPGRGSYTETRNTPTRRSGAPPQIERAPQRQSFAPGRGSYAETRNTPYP